MAKLNTFVHVNGTAYGPDDDVPAEVAALISNPHVWDGDPPPGAGEGVQPQPRWSGAADSSVEAPARPDEGSRAEGGGVPPKGGAGSGRDAWAAYADGKVEVAEEMSRDDIVAALVAAGVPTD